MGVTDKLEQIFGKYIELVERNARMGTKLEGFERQRRDLAKTSERFLETYVDDRQDVLDRLTHLEALIRATFVKHAEGALLKLAQDHIDQHGSLKGFDLGESLAHTDLISRATQEQEPPPEA